LLDKRIVSERVWDLRYSCYSDVNLIAVAFLPIIFLAYVLYKYYIMEQLFNRVI